MAFATGSPIRCVSLALAGMLLVLSAAGCSDGNGEHSTTRAGPPDGARIVDVRMYQGRRWTIEGETASSVGAALAALRPTYVSGLIRFPADKGAGSYEVTAWNKVRDALRAAVPHARISIELNALEYPTPRSISAKMQQIRERFDNDAWLFDFYTSAARRRPQVMAAAVASAHDNGESIGGNAFGLASNPRIPRGTDFIAVQDSRFRIDLDAVRALSKRVPAVFFHLGNAPALPQSDGCAWIRDLKTKDRRAYLVERAHQQRAYGFRLEYPLFYPECAIARRQGQRVRIYTYNATADRPVLRTIEALLDRYAGS